VGIVSVRRIVEPFLKSLYPAGLGVGTKGGVPNFGTQGTLSYRPKTTEMPKTPVAAQRPMGTENAWTHALRTLPTHLGPERAARTAQVAAQTFAQSKMGPHEFMRGFHVAHGDYRSRLSRVVATPEGGLHVRGDIFHTPSGAHVGSFRRTFSRQGGVPSVRHDEFVMHNDHRGSGYGTHFYGQMEDHYRKAGVGQVTMRANYKVGPYVWAMNGYDFARPIERRTILRRFDDFLEKKGAPPFQRRAPMVAGHAPQHPVHSWEIATYRHEGRRLGKEFLTQPGNQWQGEGDTSYAAVKTLDPRHEGYRVGAAYQRVHMARGRAAQKNFKKALFEQADEPKPEVEAMERTMEPWHEDELGDAAARDAVQKVIDDEHGPSEDPTQKSLSRSADEKHTGAVLMLWPRIGDARALAWAGGEQPEKLHVTLAYLGKADALSTEQRRGILRLAGEWARRGPFTQYVTGVHCFRTDDADASDAVVALIAPTVLTEARVRLMEQLHAIGVHPDMKFPEYKPHMTLAYIPRDSEVPQFDLGASGVVLDRLVVTFGNEEHVFRLEQPRTGVAVTDSNMTDVVSPPGLLPQVWKSEGTWMMNTEWVAQNCEFSTLVKAVRRVAAVSPVGQTGMLMNKPASPNPAAPRQPSQPALHKPSHPTHPTGNAGGEAKVPRMAGGHIDWNAVPEGMAVWVTIKNEASPLYGRAVRIVRRGGGFAMAGGTGVIKQQAMLAGTSPSKLMDELNREHQALGRMGMPKETIERRERMLKPLAERGRLAPTEGLSSRDIHELARVHTPVFPGARPPEESEGRKKARRGATSVAGQAVRRTLTDKSRFIRRESKSIRANIARAAGMRIRDIKKATSTRWPSNSSRKVLPGAASSSARFPRASARASCAACSSRSARSPASATSTCRWPRPTPRSRRSARTCQILRRRRSALKHPRGRRRRPRPVRAKSPRAPKSYTSPSVRSWPS
jgi:GNAT superfamily N-acetyltransferase